MISHLMLTHDNNSSNQEYLRGHRATEVADPEGCHTINEMKAWLKPFGYSDAINDATINAILREFVMTKVNCDEMSNMDI